MGKRPPRGASVANALLTEEREATELEVLRLARDGKSFGEIAKLVGYANNGGAWKAYNRAIQRTYAAPVAELREAQGARLMDLILAQWPAAMGGSTQAAMVIVRLEERMARLWGLDHADGVAERLVQLEADKVRLMAMAFGKVLDDLGLDAEQRERASRNLIMELRKHTEGDPGVGAGVAVS